MLPSCSTQCLTALPSSFCLAGVTLPSSGSHCRADTELGSFLLEILSCPCFGSYAAKEVIQISFDLHPCLSA